MSESRRRKVRNESEGLSDTSFDDNIKQFENESDINITADSNVDGGDSEYETVDEIHSESEEEIDIELNHEDEEDGEDSDDDSQVEGSIILDLERQSGDGQEQATKKVDDDEDRSNPQYIPKRGTFYEHDDRTAEDGAPEESEAPSKEEEQEGKSVEKVTKSKKVWQQSQDRWTHDRYDDDEQAPKSRSELIAAYGYDIRNEEGPPRARRRRRYGRGPNTYTRKWQNEEDYGKAIPTNQRKPCPEDFPALGQQNSNSPRLEVHIEPEQNDCNRQVNASEIKEDATISNTPMSSQIPPHKGQQNNDTPNVKSVTSVRVHHSKKEHRRNGEIENTKYDSQKSYSDYDKSNATSETRNRRLRQSGNGNGIGKSNNDKAIKGFKNKNNTLEFKNQSRNKFNNHNSHGSSQFSDNYTSDKSQSSGYYENVNDLETSNIISQSFSNTKLKNDETISLQHNRSDRINSSSRSLNNSAGNSNHRSTNVIPPRLQNTEANRPKRYSSLRQRSVQEPPSGFQQQQQQQSPNYYSQEFQQQINSQSDQTITVPTSVIQPSPHMTVNSVQIPNVTLSQQIPPQNMGVPPPVVPYTENTTTSQVISQTGAPPTVLPQQVLGGTYSAPVQYPAAAPYLIQQPLNFAVPPPQPPQFQPSFQPYSGYNGVAPPQPGAALFQPQGGITYYSPQGQPMPPRPPQRRPTAAIPILPPPPTQPRGRGRGTEQNSAQQPGTVGTQDQENSHNIDHILDNMFVQRHPYNPMTDSASSTVSNNGVSSITNQLNELNVAADIKDTNSLDGKYINNLVSTDDTAVTSSNINDEEIVTTTTTTESVTIS